MESSPSFQKIHSAIRNINFVELKSNKSKLVHLYFELLYAYRGQERLFVLVNIQFTLQRRGEDAQNHHFHAVGHPAQSREE